MRKFVLGDVHGGYKSMMQVFERSGIDYKNDLIISVGDICDGWPEVPECFEELFKFENFKYMLGNHDDWTLMWMNGKFNFNSMSDMQARSWLAHGGEATLSAYTNEKNYDFLKKHKEFLENEAMLYYVDDENRWFSHAGWDPLTSKQVKNDYIWSRDFWRGMYDGRNFAKDYEQVFIGHTPTINFPDNKHDCREPIHRKNVWNVDTGACYTGRVTLMDIDTFEYYQSDDVQELYPDFAGRNNESFNSREARRKRHEEEENNNK